MEPTLWEPPAELSYQDRIRGGYDRKRPPKAPGKGGHAPDRIR